MAEITAPMSGKVFKINVNIGDKVEIDDEVVILEAMKMETPIFASDAGVVKEIKVSEGDNVSDDEILVIIE